MKRFPILIVLVVLLLILVSIYVLRIDREREKEFFDFIDNYSSAKKSGMTDNLFLSDYLLVGEKSRISKDFREELALLFSNSVPLPIIDNREFNLTDKGHGAALRLTLSLRRKMEENIEIVFRKFSEETYSVISVNDAADNVVSINSYQNSKQIISHSAPIQSFDGDSLTLLIIYYLDRIIVLERDRIIFQAAKLPMDAQKSVSSIQVLSSLRSRYSLKFEPLQQDQVKELSETYTKTLKTNSIIKPAFGNLTGPAHFNHNDASRRAIPFPAGGRMEYNLRIPERSFFDFGIFTPDSPGEQLIMKINISDEGRDIIDKEFTCEKRGHLQNEQIDLSGWGGKEVKFSFSVRSPSDTSVDTMRAILLVNPVIRRTRKAEEKNILFIMLDTLRADHLGCYGYHRDTSPHIDEFAKEALLFQNAFSQSSWTLPSHYSIFTSLYPYEAGYTPVYNQDMKSTSSPSLPLELDTLSERLKEAGYLTLATTGSGYLNSAYGLDQGFEEYWNNFHNEGLEISISTERVNNWIEKNKHLKWFIFFHTYEIHDPYDRSFFKGNIANGEANNIIARYDSGIRYADKYVGQIIEKLKSAGLLENTVVIITSDHGESFYKHNEPTRKEERGSGRHGHNLYDNLIRVPLIIGGMGNMRQKRVVGNVELTDLMPTILDLAGVQVSENIRGRSLASFSRGEQMKKKSVYSEAIEGPIETEMKSLRSDIHKLIYNANPSKPEYEFYNIKEDPHETTNLSGKGATIKDIFTRKLKMILKSIQKGRGKLFISSSNPVVSDELMKQLKALGYIGE